MKLLSLGSFKDNLADTSIHSWPWPMYCQQPRTLSFRDGGGEGVFRTVDSTSNLETSRQRRQILVSMETEEEDPGLSLDDDVAIKTAVTAARLERRLFFNPEETSSILEVAESEGHAPFIEDSVAVSMDSRDPYMDFRRSMGEMVAVHSLKGKSNYLEELVCWYLKANDKANHGYIFAAFVDLLVTIQASGEDCSSSSAHAPSQCYNLTQSPSSLLSFYTSSTSNSCCSSSTSSPIPCHATAIVSTEENNGGSSESTVAATMPSVLLNVAEPIGDDSSSTALVGRF